MATDRLPSLDRLAAFDASARHLSFTKAASELFLTQSAVSRQIAALEEDIGAPLFRRRHRALDLTDDGRRLATAVTTALAVLRDTVDAIRSPSRREVLTLTTTPGLASLWLIPRLSDFVKAHPGIDVRIDASYEPRSLAGEGYDIAVRYGRVHQMAGTPLFEETLEPVCAPSLLKAGPPLKSPADLKHHTLLQMASLNEAHIPVEWQSWLAGVGAGDIEPQAMLTFNNYDTAVAAAVAGQGVVLGRRPLVDGLLRQKTLVTPFKGAWAPAKGYVLVTSAASARRPAVQALQAWLLVQAQVQAREP